jgi:hypothetical protein
MLSNLYIPWHPIDAERGIALERELARELSPAHAIYGRAVKAVAACQDCDDVLFEVDEGKSGYAVVHLTWIMKMETTPNYPSTEIFQSLEAWRVQRMIPDAEDWNS